MIGHRTIKELMSEDVSVRVNYVKNLSKIAESLGPDRYRDEVIPELKFILDDEDEVQLALADELGKLSINQIGGQPHIQVIFPHLESLAKVEDNTIREKAIAALTNHGSKVLDQDFEKNIVELVLRLSSSDFFSPKCSATELIVFAYSRATSDYKKKLISEFKKSTVHKTPMVRRSAASALNKLTALVDSETLNHLIEDLKALSVDDQDSVRLLVVENCVSFAKLLSEEAKVTIVKPIVLSCGSDKSWRVRYMVANLFAQLVESLGKDITQQDLVPVFVNLLKDSEPEVRTAASSKVSGVSKLLNNRETVIKEILPCIKALSTDESSAVRSSLASDVMGLAPLFGKEGTNEHLLDLFLQLLKDETPEVRLNVIGKLDQVTQVLGLDQLSLHLLPAIVELAEDRQWRIRLSILEYIPLLAEQLGVQFFNQRLSDLAMSWLNDCVFSVREAATTNFKKLTVSFGVEWSKQHILPKVVEQIKHRNYLYRTTSLTMITALSEVYPAQDIHSSLLPLIFTLYADPIPNIRINASKSLDKIIPRLEASVLSGEVVVFLKKRLEVEQDKDVIYFSNLALQNAQKK